jgi:hypothetical protein
VIFIHLLTESIYLGAHLGFSSKGITPLKAQVEIFMDDMHQHKKKFKMDKLAQK